jgi:hypothetical protein
MFNNGSDPNGNWTLYIFDNAAVDEGILIDWSISFDTTPAIPPPPFTASELPIFKLNTNSQVITDDPKIIADLNIYWMSGQAMNTTSQIPHYTGKIGIEYRGSSSQTMFPKKGYGFETWNVDSSALNFPIVGFPSESDWILNANYSDKSVLNNTLTYQLFRDFGHYAPRTKHVEFVLNDEYQGIYIVMEKIKRDSNRVDIAKLTDLDISGDDLTGGYIIKIDKFTGSGGSGWDSQFNSTASTPQPIFFQYEYPSETNILPIQQNYIQQFVDSFETALMSSPLGIEDEGWRQYADEQSFIDYLIINELSKNVDGYRLSTYLHKDKNSNGGKLTIGPVWDYDLGYGNANYCEGEVIDGWAFNLSHVGCGVLHIPFWWEKLMEEDELFKRKVSCRYRELRDSLLSLNYLNAYIDSSVALIQNAIDRNYSKWPVLGSYVWPNPAPYPADYAGEINELKTWLQNRLIWLDANMPDACDDLGINEKHTNDLSLFPNPVQNEFTVQSGSPIEKCEFYTVNGQSIDIPHHLTNNQLKANTNDLQKGVYLVKVYSKSSVQVIKFIKE